MNRRPLLLAAVAALVAAGIALVIAGRGSFAGAEPRLAPDDAQLVARGEAVYRTHCAACHGAKLEGQPNWRERRPDGLMPAPPHDDTGHTWHHADEVLFRITKEGVGKVANMPQYKSAMPVYDGVLSDRDIVAVLSWIKAQWSPEIRKRHDEINRRYLDGR
ncbi:MAG TPA: cytochrome c [Albitalea sp.]